MQKLLLIVNPNGGRRRGRLQGEHAISLLNANNIKTDVRLTEYPGHASKLARSLDLTHYDGLCIVGGDGTIHEVVNGLMNRLQPVATSCGSYSTRSTSTSISLPCSRCDTDFHSVSKSSTVPPSRMRAQLQKKPELIKDWILRSCSRGVRGLGLL